MLPTWNLEFCRYISCKYLAFLCDVLLFQGRVGLNISLLLVLMSSSVFGIRGKKL